MLILVLCAVLLALGALLLLSALGVALVVWVVNQLDEREAAHLAKLDFHGVVRELAQDAIESHAGRWN